MNSAAETQPLPVISVIIAVYNGARHLREQMDALLAQNCGFPWEAIYVDNGSRDDSREIIRARIAADNLTHVRLADGSQKPGQVHARNFGTTLARADLLAFTDQDDLPAPGWLVGLVAALSRSQAVGGYVVLTPHGHPPPPDRDSRPPAHALSLNYDGFACAVGTNTGIHRSLLEAVGGWQNLSVHAGEDADLSIRLHLAGHPVFYAPEARVTWRARTACGDIFRQGVTYGRSNVQLYARYRTRGLKRPSVRTALRLYKQTLFALADFFRTPRSYQFVFQTGLRWGHLIESFRLRVFYP